MKTALKEHSEKLKKDISTASQKSKEIVKSIVDNHAKQVNVGLHFNKKMITEIKDQLHVKELDPEMLEAITKAYGQSIEHSEETIDAVIDFYNQQLEQNIDFNTKMIEVLNEIGLTDKEDIDKLMNLVESNFQKNVKLSKENLEHIVSSYNKHINLAHNFNKKFIESINSQLEMLFNLHGKNFDMFNKWVDKWWAGRKGK